MYFCKTILQTDKYNQDFFVGARGGLQSPQKKIEKIHQQLIYIFFVFNKRCFKSALHLMQVIKNMATCHFESHVK